MLANIYKYRHLARSATWLCFKYHDFKKKLTSKYALSNVRIYKFTNWHHGCNYFTAYYQNNKVFIKTDFGIGLLKNEITAFNHLKGFKNSSDLILEPLLHDKENYTFIAYEFLNLPTLDKIIARQSLNQESLSKITMQLLKILDLLHEAELVYRDMKLDNIFVRPDTSLILIDFMFSISPKRKLGFSELDTTKIWNKSILKNMGCNAQKKKYVWDDAYAMKSFLDTINSMQGYNDKMISHEIDKRLNRLQYSLNKN